MNVKQKTLFRFELQKSILQSGEHRRHISSLTVTGPNSIRTPRFAEFDTCLAAQRLFEP